ncbi:NACHT domain-containing protein [Phormidesmis sp. 146-35]
MEEKTSSSVPSWLDEPPTPVDTLPVQTRLQALPLEELTWENFEKLCLRLARLEAGIESCQLYGERGDKQEGIDIYARKPRLQSYVVYQCKRVNDFGPYKIREAISKFLEGDWVDKTETFILCTKESLGAKQRTDELESQSKILQSRGITLVSWDSRELSIKLKQQPELVSDFFGRAWVIAFCGQEQAERLGDKTEQIVFVRNYIAWLANKTAQFVVPALSEEFSIKTNWIPLEARCIEGDRESFKAELIKELYPLSIIIGHPGSGKSTLLRRMACELSCIGKKVLLVRLPEVLRLWRSKGGKTFSDAILENATDGLNLNQNIIRQALKNADYLLADGLDECNTDRANVAEQLISWAAGHPAARVVTTNRIGYEPELLPGWKQVEIQPLDKESLQKYFKKLLTTSPIEQDELEKKLALFENLLQDEKLRSLVSRSPLLLGFIVQLIRLDVDLRQKNRTEIYKAVINLACEHLPQHRESIELSKRSAKRVLEIAGWKLMHQPLLTEEELVESLTQELEERGFTSIQAEEEAEKGIIFWRNQRMFDCFKLGYQKVINFVHLSLCEYAAGQYASHLSEVLLREWIQQVRQDSSWRETICFAAGLGRGERIATYLLELDNSEDTTSPEALLAIKVAAEASEISPELLEALIERIQPRLKSSSPDIAFKATEALLLIANKGSRIIASIAVSLLASTYSWTQVSAMSLALNCCEDSIDANDLKEVIKQIITESVVSKRSPFSGGSARKCSTSEWKIRDQVIVKGCQLLLKRQSNVETANEILQLTSQGSLNVGTHILVEKLLRDYISENLKSSVKQEDKKKWVDFWQKLTRPNKLFAEFSPRNTLLEIERKERAKCGDRVFLEAVLRLTGIPTAISESRQQAQESVTLGILLKGMGWWNMPTTYWDLLGNSYDLEAIDTVLRGMIFILNINSQILATEAVWMLENTNRFFSFDLASIKALLQSNTVSENLLALKQLQKIYEDERAVGSIFSQSPKVPVDFKWERATQIQLPSTVLVQALEHPSIGIRWNAGLLIKHGAGGQEAIEIAKSVIGEDKWQEFEAMQEIYV